MGTVRKVTQESAEVSTSNHPVVIRFTRYLNGPMGRSVLENLEEGESFVLQTSQHTLRVTKKGGKAAVRMISLT